MSTMTTTITTSNAVGAATGPALIAEDLCHAYGDRRVLDGLNLQVQRGEILALLGSNGAGKTTLLSILTGLRQPSSGRVRVFGRDPRQREARGSFGTMLQDGELPPSFRVVELIEFFRRLYAQPLQVDGILAMASLQGMAQAPVSTLSGGQKQRLKFALAVAGDPPLLFLDEPTVAMDAESRQQFRIALRGRAALGRSIVLTTHHMDDVEAVADRVAILHAGRVVACGTPAQIKASMGGKLLHFRSDTSTHRRLQWLSGVTDVSQVGDLWCLQSSRAEDSVRELLRCVPDVSDLTVRSFDLEESLMSLTATAAQGEPA